MDATELPVDVLVTALTSRLADLQSARTDAESTHLTPPQPQDGADRRALVAGHLLGALEHRLMAGSSEFASIESLADAMRERLSGLATEEVRFCARFLDVDREIRFRTDIEGEARQTRAWTRLVRYQARLDRAKLTEAGRLFLKVLRHRRDWLYEDKHIEMLGRAIRSGLFDDVPRLCQEILSSLRLFNEQLTAIRESPSIRLMAEQYEARREHFTGMLERSLAAALDALELLRSQAVRDELERFRALHPDSALSLAGLARGLRLVHQATESLNRSWARLLGDLQRDRRPRLGVIRFDAIMSEFVQVPPTLETMEALLGGCCGWVARSQLASAASFIGTLELEVEPPTPAAVVFDDDPSMASSHDQFSAWLKLHEEAIVAALRHGPIRLSELLDSGRVGPAPLDSITDMAGALGMYVVSDPLGQRLEVEVACSPALVRRDAYGYAIIASDLSLQLRPAPGSKEAQ